MEADTLSIRAFGGVQRRGIGDDIDARLESLRQSMSVVEAAYLQFTHFQERQSSIIESMEFFKSRQLPLFRQQLLQAVDIKLGRVEAFNAAATMQASALLRRGWRRADPAQIIIEGVAVALKSEQGKRKDDRRKVVQEIQKTEALMIENLRPVALLEAPKEENTKAPLQIPHLDQ